MAISYTLTPELADTENSVYDCVMNDIPSIKNSESFRAKRAAGIGMIGKQIVQKIFSGA